MQLYQYTEKYKKQVEQYKAYKLPSKRKFVGFILV